jgi:tRNA dimethylallyltransferase
VPDALAEMKQETRRLAKRQLTWFRGDPRVIWHHPSQRHAIFSRVEGFLASEG